MGEKVKKSLGVADMSAKKFKTLSLPEEWKRSMGLPADNFSAIIYGMPGNGKTDFCMKLAKMLSKFGKVFYNSLEQGWSQSLKECIVRHRMIEVDGKVVFGMDNYADLVNRLSKPKSPKFIIIDSRDYMGLTATQFKYLRGRFAKKSIIVVCHEKGAKPKGEDGAAIEFMCDIKIRVRLYIADVRSRYGGNEEYVSWAEGAKAAREKIIELKQIPLKK